MRDRIAEYIAYLLPRRVVYFTVLRDTMHEHTRDEFDNE